MNSFEQALELCDGAQELLLDLLEVACWLRLWCGRSMSITVSCAIGRVPVRQYGIHAQSEHRMLAGNVLIIGTTTIYTRLRKCILIRLSPMVIRW